MKQTFTQEDLIRYIYHETDVLESKAIRESIESDLELRNTFSNLVFAKSLLVDINCNPVPSSVNRILKYSKNTSARELRLS